MTPVISVSQLNRQVRFFLEEEIGTVHVEGEISNLSKPSSGHFYFTLKDASSQIRCVFFKNRHIPDSKSILKDGQQIVINGRLSLYEARGDYQLIIDSITDSGFGILYQQFEALKKKLAAEGLFDNSRKKPLPTYPQIIGVITSSSGAALRDIIATLARRFPLAKVLVFSSEVQGVNAPKQLIKALSKATQDNRSEVLILARGGGSIEDLWAFNDEQLAREIASCKIPIVSGVGHETDFTIADFVADCRAATPTAAAETVTPNWIDLLGFYQNRLNCLIIAMEKLLEQITIKLTHLSEKIYSPQTLISTHWQTLDFLNHRLNTTLEKILTHKKQTLNLYYSRLLATNPKTTILQAKTQLNKSTHLLNHSIETLIQTRKQQLKGILSTLNAVSPLATLDRGYAIATKGDKILFSTTELNRGDTINIRLSEGTLDCKIKAIK